MLSILIRRVSRISRLAGFLCLVSIAGCGDPQTSDRSAAADDKAQSTLGINAAGATSEYWEAVFLQGAKVGCGQSVVRNEELDGRKVVRTDIFTRISVVRKTTAIEQEITATGWETPDGELVRFVCEMKMGTAPTVVKGNVKGDILLLETSTAGKTEMSNVPWSRDWGGLQATELSLTKQPMRPGEKRKLKQLEMGFWQVADIELKAADLEPTPLLDHTEDLLRIQRTSSLPGGQTIEQLLWTNRAGEILKTRFEAFNNETFRCSKETALQKGSPVQFDLILSNYVKTDRPIANPHRTKRVRYLVQVEGGDMVKLFPAGATQQLKPLGQGTAELTVTAIRPDDPAETTSKEKSPADSKPEEQKTTDAKPTDDDRGPNNLIQSDDKKVVELAKQAAGHETDPWKVALLLEKFVNRYITKKDFTQGFATAAEVAANPEGDCTEHAVLLAGLARARGIPARCCIGLVYVEGHGFGYHMWTEVWIKDRWFPIDATLGRGGIGAVHLKLASTNLKGASAFSAFLPVAHVMGRLKVKVLEVE